MAFAHLGSKYASAVSKWSRKALCQHNRQGRKSMKHRNSHLLVGYWSRLRRGRAVPDQTDIDPRAIKRMLSYVFILDASDTERPVYRLAGTSLCECFGVELKTINFLSHWESQSRSVLR